ncbi:hypothetical protein GGR57DRAFT_500314 [Xylariaceae sp. FL1272]|nr:hypothetical protein GGR57DRAFT_500314 [Xylariaceae sp. FL1272]
MSTGQPIVELTTQDIRKMQPKPMTFLSLAPETSTSYPSAQNIKPAAPRRSSSHPDEHKEDYHEVAVE